MLQTGGIDAVRIEPLARKLGVTKGSFYWHFQDREALHTAILDQWRLRHTSAFINRLNRSVNRPRERLQLLAALPRRGKEVSKDVKLELSIREWAKRDDAVHTIVSEVDASRLDYIATLMIQCGLPATVAHDRAFYFYSGLLGEALIVEEVAESLSGLLDLLLFETTSD